MAPNIPNFGFFQQFVACCFALRCTLGKARPAFQSLDKSHYMGSDLHSSSLEVPYNVFNRKRPSGNQQTSNQLDISGFDTHWADLGIHHYLEAVNPTNNENSRVTKRQSTDWHGYDGRIPPPDPDPLALTLGFTDLLTAMEFEVSPTSFLPSASSLIPQERRLFNSENSHLNVLTPESMFESVSRHEMGTNNDDLKISRLFEQLQSPEFENIDAQRSLSAYVMPRCKIF
ncbi:uncharacterized protein PGTG_08273 [Puccinia graminis f. sp. tritici CRL 75-36-700-3]|uniref:Uncharacterized protein n=1 Tax=Puccinia graminis f. sp. tritici (strain CRL 75-36-700-3 / race SCCL) TaxID=418459 RepID=E3KCA0_PUCGT|nr:uncharacterized protein PGTG_08273 [Puccinia graminis f. sp. tritici CRL 75-36-700-3]EFP82024.1 hypothetical protein PGTG_08273 [Puccinia graminis f. sp. tritici CRL 75-36-700-3]